MLIHPTRKLWFDQSNIQNRSSGNQTIELRHLYNKLVNGSKTTLAVILHTYPSVDKEYE